MKLLTLSILLCATIVGTIHTFAVDEIQIGRYTTMSMKPTAAQKDVFETIVDINFDTTIQTVEQAVALLTQEQGLTLVLPPLFDEPHVFYHLKLPSVHRRIGPMTLRDALETLAGPAWRLVVDPIHRIVSFEVCHSEHERVNK